MEDPIITTPDTIPPMLTDDDTETIRQTNFVALFPGLDWSLFQRQSECIHVIDYFVYYRNRSTNEIYSCHKLTHQWSIPSDSHQLWIANMPDMW
jgi:hypothetical protein